MVDLQRKAKQLSLGLLLCLYGLSLIFTYVGATGLQLAHAAQTTPKAAETRQLPPPPVLEQPPAPIEKTSPRMANLPTRNEPLSTRVDSGTSLRVEQIQDPLMPRAKLLDSNAKAIHDWQEPKTLLNYLKDVGSTGPAAVWAIETENLVRQLEVAIVQGTSPPTAILQRLEKSVEQADVVAQNTSDHLLARKVRQAGYALARRVALWEEAVKINNLMPIDVRTTRADVQQLTLCMNDIDALVQKSPQGKAWREYLMIDALRAWTRQPDAANGAVPHALAREALQRLTINAMTLQQRQFVAQKPVAALVAELHRLAAEPVDPYALLQRLEQYEESRLPSDARRLAEDCQYLAVASDAHQQQLGQQLDAFYRNANLRVAVSAELLNRLMPPQPLQYAPVRETVLGAAVRGESLTSTDISIRPLPDPNRIRVALVIAGDVASQTSSTSGPATFYNRGHATYTARKIVDFDLDGFHSQPAEVDVRNDLRLRGLETDFDNIPLLNSLAKNIARSQLEQNQPAANREVRQKVTAQARQRVDEEAKARLGEFTQKIQERVLSPLHALALDPQMISAETTEQRMLMRLRLAGEDQLGSHTPRPQAPGNSLLSFQVHESAINNALGRLKLEGKTFTMLELVAHVAKKFNCEEPWEVDPDNEDVSITFAATDAVQVRCEDNQVVLTVSIAKLSSPPRYWKDFQIRAFYTPRIEGRSALLIRDGIVHLLGDHLNTGSQIALRGIFSKVFSKNTPLDLTPQQLAENKQLADTEISQFTIDDGWIGVALAPKAAAVKTAQGKQEAGVRR
jgi:hypothetical protein